MPEREAGGDGLGEAAEVTPYPLPDRLERLEAGGALRRVDADALGRAVVDGDKDRDLAFARDRGGQVGAPECVHRLGTSYPSSSSNDRRSAAACWRGVHGPDPSSIAPCSRRPGRAAPACAGAAARPPGQHWRAALALGAVGTKGCLLPVEL